MDEKKQLGSKVQNEKEVKITGKGKRIYSGSWDADLYTQNLG